MSERIKASPGYVRALEQDRDSSAGLLEELEQVQRQRDQFGKELSQVTAQVELLQDDIGRLEEALGTAEAHSEERGQVARSLWAWMACDPSPVLRQKAEEIAALYPWLKT